MQFELNAQPWKILVLKGEKRDTGEKPEISAPLYCCRSAPPSAALAKRTKPVQHSPVTTPPEAPRSPPRRLVDQTLEPHKACPRRLVRRPQIQSALPLNQLPPTRTTSSKTSPCCAPSAKRTPISKLRRATISESAAYKPTAARSSAVNAKHVSSPASKRANTVDWEMSSSNVVTAKTGRSRFPQSPAFRALDAHCGCR